MAPTFAPTRAYTALQLLLIQLEAAADACQRATTVYIYGFPLPVNSKWSFANAFEYLVGVSATVAAHSLMQLLISVSRLLRKSPLIPSRNHAWLTFAGDQ
ncbi:hypothetical protein ACFX2J_037529 [Malus domestica]